LASGLFLLGPAAPCFGQTAAADPAVAWSAWVTDNLHLSADQQAGLKTYVADVYARGAMKPALSADDYHALSFPQRLDLEAANLSSDVIAIRARADAARRFYATLTQAQQKQFDDVMDPPRGRPGIAPDATPLAAAVAKNYALPSHTDPDWLVRPSADDMSRVYPTAADQKQIPGKVRLQCAVDVDGFLADCEVKEETPTDMGFGNAALETTAYMRMKPATDFGVPVRGSVIVTLNFALPPEPGH
jgi:TonB family protein